MDLQTQCQKIHLHRNLIIIQHPGFDKDNSCVLEFLDRETHLQANIPTHAQRQART